jgi:hypothetical protein
MTGVGDIWSGLAQFQMEKMPQVLMRVEVRKIIDVSVRTRG